MHVSKALPSAYVLTIQHDPLTYIIFTILQSRKQKAPILGNDRLRVNVLMLDLLSAILLPHYPALAGKGGAKP